MEENMKKKVKVIQPYNNTCAYFLAPLGCYDPLEWLREEARKNQNARRVLRRVNRILEVRDNGCCKLI